MPGWNLFQRIVDQLIHVRLDTRGCAGLRGIGRGGWRDLNVVGAAGAAAGTWWDQSFAGLRSGRATPSGNHVAETRLPQIAPFGKSGLPLCISAQSAEVKRSLCRGRRRRIVTTPRRLG